MVVRGDRKGLVAVGFPAEIQHKVVMGPNPSPNLPPAGWIKLFEHLPVYQIRTVFRLSKSGFYVVKCDDFRTILVVERDDQLVIIEINSIYKNY